MKPKIFIKWYLIISAALLFLTLLWFFTKIVLMTIVGAVLLFMLLGSIFFK